MRKTCNDCGWFVAETNKIGKWSHLEAVKNQKGFCLIQDLFTEVKPIYKACDEFVDYMESETARPLE